MGGGGFFPEKKHTIAPSWKQILCELEVSVSHSATPLSKDELRVSLKINDKE